MSIDSICYFLLYTIIVKKNPLAHVSMLDCINLSWLEMKVNWTELKWRCDYGINDATS